MHQIMKTRYFFALSILALACACSRDVQPDPIQGPDDLVTITALLPDEVVTRGANQ